MLPGYSESSYEADYSIIYELLSLISFDFSTVVVLSTWQIPSPTPHPRIKALGQVSYCVMHITDEIPLITVGLFFLWKGYESDICRFSRTSLQETLQGIPSGWGLGEPLADFPLMLVLGLEALYQLVRLHHFSL